MIAKRPAWINLLLGFVAAAACVLMAREFVAQVTRPDAVQAPNLITIAILLQRGAVAAWTGLIVLAAVSSGCAVMRMLRLSPRRPGLRAVFAAGVGMGLISIITLILGAAGLAQPIILIVMLVCLMGIGVPDVRQLLAEAAARAGRLRRAAWHRWAMWAVIALFTLMSLTRPFEPPSEYDSLEYHLAAPAAYHRAGRVFFMAENVYANFPQNGEMMHFLGMRLMGSPDEGAQVGMMLGAVTALLTCLALMRLFAAMGEPELGDVAAAIFATWPAVTRWAGIPYVELPLIFYGTLAFIALAMRLRRRDKDPARQTRWAALAGIAAGFALGTKYTAALFVVVVAVAWMIAYDLWLRTPLRRTLRHGLILALAATVVFAPWMIRNAINTGSPFYPLLYGVLGSRQWSVEQDCRWKEAHAPEVTSPAGLVSEGRETLFVTDAFSERFPTCLFFLFAPLALLARRRIAWLAVHFAALCLIIFLIWYYFALHNARFLAVAMPLAAGVSAIGFGVIAAARLTPVRAGVWGMLIVLLLFAPSRWWNYFHFYRSAGVAIGAESPQIYFERGGMGDWYQMMQAMNDDEIVSPNAKVLFLGEARSFYCRRACLAPTVFNPHPLEEIVSKATAPEQIADALQQAGFTHIYVDTSELARLQSSYAFECDGREQLGMLDGFNWPLFGEFARRHLKPVRSVPEGAAATFPWRDWPKAGPMMALYEIE